jgi:hypothetical protein
MIRHLRPILLAAVVAGGTALLPSTAHALRIVSPTDIWGQDFPGVGIVANVNGVPTVIWKRWLDETCKSLAIGTSGTLSDDTHVNGSSGADMISVEYSFNGSMCGISYTPLTLGGFYLDVHGMAGRDHLWTNFGNTWLWGGGDLDFLSSSNPNGSLIGHDGDDDIYGTAAVATGQALYGGPGNDCLSIDGWGTPAAFDCGDGSDWRLDSPANMLSCETLSPTGACTQ